MADEKLKQALLKNLGDELAETKKDKFVAPIEEKSFMFRRKYISPNDSLFNETVNFLYAKLLKTYTRIILMKISRESDALTVEEINKMLKGLCHYIATCVLAEIAKTYPENEMVAAGIENPVEMIVAQHQLAEAAEEAQELWTDIILAKAKHALYPTEENNAVVLALSETINETSERIDSINQKITMLKLR